MNALVNRANRQLENIKRDLSSLHATLNEHAQHDNCTILIGQLAASFSGLHATVRDLDALATTEAAADKRALLKEYAPSPTASLMPHM